MTNDQIWPSFPGDGHPIAALTKQAYGLYSIAAQSHYMIQVMDNVPANTAGFRAIGEVNADDYKQVLIPGLDRLVEKQGSIHFLLVLDTDMSDFSIGALLQDLGVGLKHFTKWHKMAIVSESKAINIFTDLFSYVAPGTAKGFTHQQLDEAIQWVSN